LGGEVDVARRIALFLRADRNDYQELLLQDARAAAQRCGLPLGTLMGQNDAAQQQRQIRDCFDEPAAGRPAALVVFPVSESGILPLAQTAARLGIGWVTLNRSTDFMEQLRLDYPALPLFCVNPDQLEIGRIQGKQVKAFIPNGGQVVCIQGPTAVPSAQLRLAGLKQELEGTGTILSVHVADWSFAGGADAAKRWMDSPAGGNVRDCVVLGQNDEMALGARTVIKGASVRRPELASLRFAGCDGTPGFGQRLVAEGQLDATVVVPSTSGVAVEQLAAVLRGRSPPMHDFSPVVTSLPDLSQLRGLARGTAA
jgi:ABC-type sugar transport system substrate-binding protein